MRTLKLLLAALVAGCMLLVINSGCTKRPPPQPPVENKPPVANAGTDQTIMKPQDNTFLSGDLSHDPEGGIVSYEWRTVAGPNYPNMDKDQILITGLKPYVMFVSGLQEGIYQFELLVTDTHKATSRDTMIVTVLPDSLTRDPSKMKRLNGLWRGDSCAIRVDNISSVLPATGSIQVFMASYSGGGPMSSFEPSTGWYQIQSVRSSGIWYEIRNDVLIIHAAANIICEWNDAAYDVLIRWD